MRLESVLFPIVRQVAKRDWLSAPLDRLLARMNPLDARRYRDPCPLYEETRTAAGPSSRERIATSSSDCRM